MKVFYFKQSLRVIPKHPLKISYETAIGVITHLESTLTKPVNVEPNFVI